MSIALAKHQRVTDDDWPGVVARLPEGWRIAVVADGSAYRLQRPARDDGRVIWCVVGFRSKPAALIREFGHLLPGLADAFAALPPNPSDAAPELVTAQRELVQRLRSSHRS